MKVFNPLLSSWEDSKKKVFCLKAKKEKKLYVNTLNAKNYPNLKTQHPNQSLIGIILYDF